MIWYSIVISIALHFVLFPYLFIRFNILGTRDRINSDMSDESLNIMIAGIIVGSFLWPIVDLVLILHFSFRKYLFYLQKFFEKKKSKPVGESPSISNWDDIPEKKIKSVSTKKSSSNTKSKVSLDN